MEPGITGRQNAPNTPHSPPGLSGKEIPLGVKTSTAPLAQGSDKPVTKRIVYGYVYDEETNFKNVPKEFNCLRKFTQLPPRLIPYAIEARELLPTSPSQSPCGSV